MDMPPSDIVPEQDVDVSRQKSAGRLLPGKRPCTKTDFYNLVWSKRFDEEWTSYYGNWFHKMHEAESTTQTALRCFKYSDGTRSKLNQINVYQKPFSPNAQARQHDSLYDVHLSYDVPASDENEGKVPLNVRTHNPATPVLVAVGEGVEHEAYVYASLSVGGSAAASQALIQSKSDGLRAFSYLLTDLFLADGPHRWSLCVCYKIESPEAEIIALNFIQEHVTRVNPEDADVITRHADLALDTRPSRLGNNAASWVPASRSGTVSGITADPLTGDLMYLDPAPVSFQAPPTADTPTHRFLLLPDGMYCLVPRSAKCAVDGRGGDFWVEFGGLMRRDGRFERLKVAYAADGSLASVLREVFA